MPSTFIILNHFYTLGVFNVPNIYQKGIMLHPLNMGVTLFPSLDIGRGLTLIEQLYVNTFK